MTKNQKSSKYTSSSSLKKEDAKKTTPSQIKSIWIHPVKNEDLIASISKEFYLHPKVSQILISRGIDSVTKVHDFLYGKLPDLLDPFLMKGMEKAVDRILKAIEKKEGILIFGDNDVDGMTGCALLTQFLRFLGGRIHFFLTQRGTSRHDIVLEAEKYAIKKNATLVITVDFGITASKEIGTLKEKGIDVIVTDHHEPTAILPHCVATLNPKLKDNDYPNKDLTGVGAAFKLIHAITLRLPSDISQKIDLKRYLDLVALGTIADMGKLMGENRIFVAYGLQQVRKRQRVGLEKLILSAEVNLNELSPFIIATKIAPRINCVSRIDDPYKGVDMLLTEDEEEADAFSELLNKTNLERQKIEKQVFQEIDPLLQKQLQEKRKAILLRGDHWHSGVIASISTRLCKQYHRPVLILTKDKEILKGSIRSIPEFPLLPSLKKLSRFLIQFGGHDFAAGLSLKKDDFSEFEKEFFKETDSIALKDLQIKTMIDAKVDFDELTFDLMESLKLLEPYGCENPEPIFLAGVKLLDQRVLPNHKIKLSLLQNDLLLEGIMNLSLWNQKKIEHTHSKKGVQDPVLLDILYTPEIKESRGRQSIQLIIKDFKLCT